MIAGYGDSGKLRNYFSEETLDELGTKAGVRADHPIEVVMDTALVARECWLFRTRSEGICTRDTVPGSAILYIRDTRPDEMLYSAQAGDAKEEDQDEEMERPTGVEAEVSPRPSSPAAAASSGAAVVSPPSTPRLREVPEVQRRGQVQECPQCRERIIVGQYICQHCRKGLRKRIMGDAARRQLASARNQYVGNIATLTGKAVADLTENDLRTTHGHDVMKRGMISLDANTIAQARKAIKRASAEGFGSIYERFTRDRTYALRMIAAGFNQRTMRQWDCLIQAVLPNPGRSHAQRRMAQGSSSRDPTGTPSTEDLCPARFVYFDEEMRNFQGENEIRMGSMIGDRLFRAGLVDESTDVPVAIAWFGSFFSLTEFSRLAARSKMADHILTFGAEGQPLNLTGKDALLMQLQSYVSKDLGSMQEAAKQARQMPWQSQGQGQVKGQGRGERQAPI